MATIKKAQAGIKKSASKMVPGEMTGKMYKKSEIDEIGRKQAAELDKSGVFGKAAMAKKKAPKAQSGIKATADSTKYFKNKMDSVRTAEKKSGKGITPASEKAFNDAATGYKRQLTKPKAKNGKEMIKRADGSYSQRGLWDNIRANKGSGKKPTAAMLKQEKKIKAKTKK
jgi:hypothetical protein